MKKILLILALIAPIVYGENSLQLSGFGTLGLVVVDSQRYGYRRDIAQDDGAFDGDYDLESNSVLGGQIDYALSPQFDWVYQSIYRNQNEFTLNSVSSIAFMRYTPSSSWEYRLGRTPIDLFLITSYRDVGFAYEWTHPPTEVYGLVPYRHLDGLDITYNSRHKNLRMRSQFTLGMSEADISGYHFPEPLELDNIYGLSFSVDALNWNLQIRYTQAQVVDSFPSASELTNTLTSQAQVPAFNALWPDADILAQEMAIKNARIEYVTLGGQYELNTWRFMGELSAIESNNITVNDSAGAYASIIYFMNTHSLQLTHAHTQSNTFDIDSLGVNPSALSDADIAELYNNVNIFMNFYASNQSTTSLGWRYDFSQNLAFKIQWDHTIVEAQGGILRANKDLLDSPKGSVNTLISNMSFMF